MNKLTAIIIVEVFVVLAFTGCSPTGKVQTYLGDTRSDLEAAGSHVDAARQDLADADALLEPEAPARPFVQRASERLSQARESIEDAQDRTRSAQQWMGGVKDKPFGILAGAADFLWLLLGIAVVVLLGYLGVWGLAKRGIAKLTAGWTESEQAKEGRAQRLAKLHAGRMTAQEVIAAERGADPSLDRKWRSATSAQQQKGTVQP